MHNFWTLVGFEYKKLLMKKMVWITLLILLGISVFMPMSSILGTTVEDESGTHSGLSLYESMKEHIKDDIEVSGRPLDEEMFTKYRETNKRETDTFTSIIYRITDSFDISNLTAERMYQIRSGNLQKDQKESYLTDKEMQYWEEQEANITKLFTYQYCSGYRCMISMFYTLVMSQVLLCAIGVSNIFAEEHTQKTDQLNLCTALGRQKLFYAKIFVGITFSLGSTMLMLLMSGIPNFIIYGTDGFDAQIQIPHFNAEKHKWWVGTCLYQ